MAIFGTLKENDLSAISASISDTAVDVFVYDTTKDSDGGAWRKRTQNTSWYNETLNTATRGSRKEFPVVAVIVAKGDDTITIYDGDDPDLPMWMVMPVLTGWDSTTRVSALNGIIVMTNHGYNGTMFHIKFIEDSYNLYDCRPGVSLNSYTSRISDRATVASYSGTQISNIGLIDADINDVAMTVLPNAPIDSATGLPIPTIAVGTEGGVSVIKDDGIVVDVIHTVFKNITQIFFTEDNLLAYLAAGTINQTYGFHYIKIPSGDLDNGTDGREEGTHDVRFYNGDGRNYIPSLGSRAYGHNFIDGAIGYNDASSGGLMLLEKNAPINYANSSIAFVNTDYNTGWMHGDIKGAFLSDTDTGEDFGPEIVTGGDFSNASQWTLGTGWSINGSGQAVHTGSAGYIEQAGTFTGGRYYQMTADLISGSAGNFGMTNRNEPNVAQPHNQSTFVDVYCVGGTKIYAMWQQRSGVNLNTINLYANNTLTVDNVSIKEISKFYYDRSVNDVPLALFGSLTKTPVATGADLVAYSGFSGSNYLQQSYNADLAPGTGAYSVSCWFKTGTSSNDQYIFDRNGGGAGSRNLLLIMNTSAGNANRFQWWHRDASGNVTEIQISDKTITDNNWHQVVALNDGTHYRVYVDGEVSSITNNTATAPIRNVVSDNNPPMFVGIRHNNVSPMLGSMALFRYSLSAPTAEQIKKMYDDEKVLFQENAKAILYGSSDAVTALAYDDTTEFLHVGTSAGRSEFQGLRRINNTTTAVTTAISAQDSLIIEQ